MKKIKILEIGMTNNIGGIETFLVNLYRHIDKNNFQIDFLVEDLNNFCFNDELLKNTNVYEFSNLIRNPFKFILFLKKLVKENKYDIIHINKNSLANPLQLIAAKISGAKCIIIHSHNTSSNLKFFGKSLHKINKFLFLNMATHYFACSQEAANWFFSKKILKSNNFFVINNAINLEKFKFNKTNRKEIRKELSISNDEIVIGHIGRFAEQKNHIFLIEIFKYIHEKDNKYRLLLVGTGDLLNKIKEKVKSYGLENFVYFLNNRTDVNKIYSAMDCFILPSLFEGLPIVGVEAQTNGLECFFSNTIDKNVKILDSAHIIDLSLSAEEWGEYILNSELKIDQNIDKILKSKFNLETEIKKIEKIFNTIHKK